MSLSELLETAVASVPTNEVIYDGNRRMTYHDLDVESDALAASLSQMGINKGDRIAVSLPNWHEFIVIAFAIAKIGAILIPFNTRFKSEEAEYILTHSEVKAIFFTREFDHVNHYEKYLDLIKTIHSLEYLIGVRFEAENVYYYHKLIEMGKTKSFSPVEINHKEDLYAILYTSGTTSKSKGAMLTHKNLVHTAVIGGEWMRCNAEDVFLLPTPIFHVMGLMFVLRTISSKARMVLMETFRPEKALSLIEQERVTIHPGVPTMFILELNHPHFHMYDLSSLRTGEMGGAPAPIEIIHRIREEMGCNILVGYGMTETSPTLSLTGFDDDDTIRYETVGRALPGVEVKVVDDNRHDVGMNKVGELICRSFGLMKGYYKDPERTDQSMDEHGWFYTGDLATIDEHGYIRIVGRKKDMIIRGGYNIYPREIEEYFYTHPAVMDVAIVGLPDTVLGEISCACISLREKMSATEEEIRNFIKGKVADYKVPDWVVFVENFPMTPSGKIRKIDLQNQLKTQIQLR